MFGIKKLIEKIVRNEIGYNGPNHWADSAMRKALEGYDPVKEAKRQVDSILERQIETAVNDAVWRAVDEAIAKKRNEMLSSAELFAAIATKMNELQVKAK